jgi:hypothetical protein
LEGILYNYKKYLLVFDLSLFTTTTNIVGGETGSCCIIKADLKLVILLLLLQECWDYRHVLPPFDLSLNQHILINNC